MIELKLHTLMGERRLKIADVARDTGINRSAITRIYNEDVERLDLDTLETLCRYLEVDIKDMLVMVDENRPNAKKGSTKKKTKKKKTTKKRPTKKRSTKKRGTKK